MNTALLLDKLATVLIFSNLNLNVGMLQKKHSLYKYIPVHISMYLYILVCTVIHKYFVLSRISNQPFPPNHQNLNHLVAGVRILTQKHVIDSASKTLDWRYQ
jgi:hypothetical protein